METLSFNNKLKSPAVCIKSPAGISPAAKAATVRIKATAVRIEAAAVKSPAAKVAAVRIKNLNFF